MMTEKSNWDIDVFMVEMGFEKFTIGSYSWFSENLTIEDAPEFCRHKNHTYKVMYFVAVTIPVVEFNFDGRKVFV